MLKEIENEDNNESNLYSNKKFNPNECDITEAGLKIYYEFYFPAKEFFKWLSYGNDMQMPSANQTYFRYREFSFTSPTEIITRYLSFNGEDDFKKALTTRVPSKIDIGPVYNRDPMNRKIQGVRGIERELIFDIDLTDYDDVRLCCSEGQMCHKDWSFVTAAYEVLDESLREDFGYEHILWVFSGRRGIHCWVCDERARKLSDDQRNAIMKYLTIYKGQEKERVSLAVDGGHQQHPFVSRSYDKCKEIFKNILQEQCYFQSEIHKQKILETLPDASILERCEILLREGIKTDDEIWDFIQSEIDKKLKARTTDFKLKKELMKYQYEVIFAHVYPRLDVNVSIHINHLLKAPFCIHPKTGRICVPIDPKRIYEFNPNDVPTIDDMLLNFQQQRNGIEIDSILEPYLDYFRLFLKNMENSNIACIAKNAKNNDISW